MTLPGLRPVVPSRRAAAAAALLVLTGIAWAAPAGAATTTTTSNPWVPGVGGTMTVGIDQAPTGCNPNTASGDTWADRLVLDAVLPSAFLVNGNGQAVYDASFISQAELQSTKPETVVYTINPKAVWSDGTPITAADFVYTWQQERGTTGPLTSASSETATAPTPTASPSTLPGPTGSTGPSLGYRQVASVAGSNHGRTVTVVFKTLYADWQSLFDYLLPAHVLTKVGWDPSCTTVDPSIDLSGGPFEIGNVVPGHRIVLVRNPRWWGQVPNLSRLVIQIASGPNQLARWLKSGKVDVALPAGYGDRYLEAVTSMPAVITQSQISLTFLQLEFSTTSPATVQIGVRQAIAHAIDRQLLVDSVVGWAESAIVPAASHLWSQSQSGYPAHKPPPQQVAGQPGYTSSTVPATSPTATPFPPDADPATTARLLGAVGDFRAADGTWELPSGKPLTLRLGVDAGNPWAAQTGPLVAHQLQEAGFTVTVVNASSAQATGIALSSGSVDVALLPMHSSPYGSQNIGWYTPLLGPPGVNGSQDWSNLDDPTLNNLLEQASQQLNPVAAAPSYATADTILWQDMVALPLFSLPSVLAWSGLTDGVAPDPSGPSLLWEADTWSLRVPPTSPDTAG